MQTEHWFYEILAGPSVEEIEKFLDKPREEGSTFLREMAAPAISSHGFALVCDWLIGTSQSIRSTERTQLLFSRAIPKRIYEQIREEFLETKPIPNRVLDLQQ